VVGAGTTYTAKTIPVFTSPTTAAYVRFLMRNAAASATNDVVEFDDLVCYYVDEDISHASGNVTIDSTGIHILNGAIDIQDAFGNTAMTAEGFSGQWLEFLATGGIYNSSYQQADTTDIAATEVSGAATLANYATSAFQSHLPYWVVSSSAGVIKQIADADYKGGVCLESSSTGAQTNRWYQDIPVNANNFAYTLKQLNRIAFIPTGGTITIKTYAGSRDATHADLGDRTLMNTDTHTAAALELAVTGTAATDLFTSVGSFLSADSAVYITTVTGGAGISTLTKYFVIASGLTADNFRVSTTLGGATINFTTDLTAGKFIVQESVGYDPIYLGSTSQDAAYIRVETEVVHSSSGGHVTFGENVIQGSEEIAYLTVMNSISDGGGLSVVGNSALIGGISQTNEHSTTPTINNGGTATFTGKSCVWSQIGQWVHVSLTFAVTANGSGASSVTVSGMGLPTISTGARVMGDRGGVGVNGILYRITNSGAEAIISDLKLASSFAQVTGADLLNGQTYGVAFMYRTGDSWT
jgi:hypothetical protein